MYKGYFVMAHESSGDPRVDQAIKNFHYEDRDVVCYGIGGYVTAIDTKETVTARLDAQKIVYEDTMEDITEKFIEFLNRANS